MKTLKENHIAISTILAFALIPLSGFATDIYLPSFPAMATFFGTRQTDIQLSLVVFIVSNGISQLFVGTLLDSYGRYRISLISLFVFAASCFVIANSDSITTVLAMRVVQGVTVALIVVGKRAFFMDVYSGDRLKQYTSMFSIIWAMAPIIAPFIGGFLHHYVGWKSNFYFLGAVALIILWLELAYGGETIKNFQSFKWSSFVNAYSSKLSKPDFILSLVILGLAFSMVMLFNMASPFIIQQVFHESAVTTGNIALLSGLAIMTGGILSRSFIHKSINSKMNILGPLLIALSGIMVGAFALFPGLLTMTVAITLMHVASGFTFNMFFTYALNRFGMHAGIVSGLTGGGAYIITSLMSFTLVGLLDVERLLMLGMAYFILSALLVISFALFTVAQKNVFVSAPVEVKQ